MEKTRREGDKETELPELLELLKLPRTPMDSGILRVMASRYTRCSMRSARSPGSMSMTGISTIV